MLIKSVLIYSSNTNTILSDSGHVEESLRNKNNDGGGGRTKLKQLCQIKKSGVRKPLENGCVLGEMLCCALIYTSVCCIRAARY